MRASEISPGRRVQVKIGGQWLDGTISGEAPRPYRQHGSATSRPMATTRGARRWYVVVDGTGGRVEDAPAARIRPYDRQADDSAHVLRVTTCGECGGPKGKCSPRTCAGAADERMGADR